MAVVRKDEILQPYGTDPAPIPRYRLVDQEGNIVADGVQLQLLNTVTQEGMPVDKVAMDEVLAASGVTAGSATAYTLAQSNFVLFDGALIRFRLHVDSGATPTLNVNGTGAKKLMMDKYKPMRAGIAAGVWLTAVYSQTLDFFLLQGSGSGATARFGNGVGQISTFEFMTVGHLNPFYTRLI